MTKEANNLVVSAGVLTGGVIVIMALQVMRIKNLESFIHLKNKEIDAWKTQYEHALSKMTLPQMLNELESTVTNIQFRRITKDV